MVAGNCVKYPSYRIPGCGLVREDPRNNRRDTPPPHLPNFGRKEGGQDKPHEDPTQGDKKK